MKDTTAEDGKGLGDGKGTGSGTIGRGKWARGGKALSCLAEAQDVVM